MRPAKERDKGGGVANELLSFFDLGLKEEPTAGAKMPAVSRLTIVELRALVSEREHPSDECAKLL